MRIRDIGLILRTIRHLRLKQVYFQVVYRLARKPISFVTLQQEAPAGMVLQFTAGIPAVRSWQQNSFTFVNRTKSFPGRVDWSFRGNGMLWAYNLNYFDFLMQDDMTTAEGSLLMESWCD